MATDQKTLVRHWVAGFNTGNLTSAEEMIAPTYVLHDLHIPKLGRGPDSYKKHVTTARVAFGGLALTIEDLFAEGDRVALRWTARGTHTGKLIGIDPTGKAVTIEGVFIARIAEGKIAEGWSYWDALGTVQQLEVVSPPFAPFPPGD